MDEDNRQGLRPGMINLQSIFAGHCYSCEHGIVNACMDNQTMGCQRRAFQYITMPERVCMTKVDPCFLQPLSRSASAIMVSAGQVKQGKVLVAGASTIGVLAAVAARQRAVVLYPMSMGKTGHGQGVQRGWQYHPQFGGFDKAVKEITDGNGFDIAIEVGLPSTFQNCIGGLFWKGGCQWSRKENLDFNFTLLRKRT